MLELKPMINALLRSKIGAVLLLIQVAITLAIVSNAAFMISDRLTYLNQETGYDEEAIFSLSVSTFDPSINLVQQYAQDERDLRAIDGVIDAAMTNWMPLSGSGSSSSMHLVPNPEIGTGVRAAYFTTNEHMLNTLGAKLIEGRNFYPEEVVHADNYGKLPNTTIVTKDFADELYPDGSALGKVLYQGEDAVEIIGIIDTIKGPWLNDSRPANVVIFPFNLSQPRTGFLVRTEPGKRAEVMAKVEELLLKSESRRVFYGIEGLDESKASYLARDTLVMRMLVVLIVVLVLVTALGIFGLTLFNISKRTKQIGTRRALGARKSAIVRYFLIENFLVAGLGLVIGAALAVLLGQQLMKVFSLPSLSFTFVLASAVFMLIMSLVAAWGPALRAAKVAPSIATRSI
ncbi:ABC transporter permease [Pseudoalteromonas sp. T1lg76]|uniref:ABC transporter permease n=1 Tax=Pseudoalteromonas sp. T1lg76 TaxID=2077103 RepID=UPI000CF65940|nr:FtsX-like permease family protein [Pseudoalteromonas sp. T1lg76]